MRITNFTHHAETCARIFAIALGFTIPISVALDNILLAAILACWIASANYRDKLFLISRNPIALAALALFALLVIGLGYGTPYPNDGLRFLGKYADLAFLPVFITLFKTERARRQAWYALAAAIALTLLLSYLIWAGLITAFSPVLGDSNNPGTFKQYLTQSIIMAFGALLFVQLARIAGAAWQRNLWAALAVLAAVNVILMSQGRTGQLIFVALAIYFVHTVWRWRGVLAALVGIVIVAGLVAQGSAAINNRFAQAYNEWKSWQPEQASQSSVGLRLEFYRNSLEIIREQPLVGAGTGSFPRLYAERVAESAMTATTNPHNEYLNILVQIGLVGLLTMLCVFYIEWRYAVMLPTPHECHLARGLVITFVIGCLFNSLLMDHVEGLLFSWVSGLLFAGLRLPVDSGAPAR